MHSFYYDSLKRLDSHQMPIKDKNYLCQKKVSTTENKVDDNFEFISQHKSLIINQDDEIELRKEIINIKDIVNRYKHLIDILTRNSKSSSTQNIIQLPNLCLTPFDSNRFKFDEQNLIKIINRSEIMIDQNEKVYIAEKLVEKIQNENLVYLHGLKGIGKSYIIYQMVAKLMALNDKYRIIYINQSNYFLISNTLKIMLAIILYDSEHCAKFDCKKFELIKSKNKMISDFVNDEIIPKRACDAINLIEDISYYYSSLNVKFIFIFDQTNLIMSKSTTFKEQLEFLKIIVECGEFKKIISASANNEIETLKVINIQEEFRFMPPISFDLEEFKAYLLINSNDLFNLFKFVSNYEEADQVLTITGGVPLEISRFFNKINAEISQSLNQLIIKYEHDFTDAKKGNERFSDDSLNKNYFDKLNSNDQEIVIKNLTRSMLGISIDANDDEKYDKRIFILDKSFKLKAFSCLAMSRILKNFSKQMDNILIDEFKLIINSQNVGNDKSILGCCVQVFIIESLCQNKLKNSKFSIQFPVHVYNQRKRHQLTISNYELIRFIGSTTPLTNELENLDLNKLYVPIVKHYPGYDLFYFDTKIKTFYLIQITIQKDAMDHVIDNDEKVLLPNSKITKAIKAWRNFLPKDSIFIEIWMIDKNNLKPKSSYNETKAKRIDFMNFIYFQEMKSLDVLANYFKA